MELYVRGQMHAMHVVHGSCAQRCTIIFSFHGKFQCSKSCMARLVSLGFGHFRAYKVSLKGIPQARGKIQRRHHPWEASSIWWGTSTGTGTIGQRLDADSPMAPGSLGIAGRAANGSHQPHRPCSCAELEFRSLYCNILQQIATDCNSDSRFFSALAQAGKKRSIWWRKSASNGTTGLLGNWYFLFSWSADNFSAVRI